MGNAFVGFCDYRSKWCKFGCILSKFFDKSKAFKISRNSRTGIETAPNPENSDREFPMALHQWSHKSHWNDWTHLTSTEWTAFPSLFLLLHTLCWSLIHHVITSCYHCQVVNAHRVPDAYPILLNNKFDILCMLRHCCQNLSI